LPLRGKELHTPRLISSESSWKSAKKKKSTNRFAAERVFHNASTKSAWPICPELIIQIPAAAFASRLQLTVKIGTRKNAAANKLICRASCPRCPFATDCLKGPEQRLLRSVLKRGKVKPCFAALARSCAVRAVIGQYRN